MKIELDDACKQNPEEKRTVDERCYCGHLKSEHQLLCEGIPVRVGHCSKCQCRHFIWFGWVFEDGSEV